MGRISTNLLFRLSAALLAAAALAFAGCGDSARASGNTVLIVLENHELNEAIGGSEPSTLDELAKLGALAVDYHAITHPSLPNYLALTGGSTFGIGDDCTECQASGANLATQLAAAGISWRAYMGGMPQSCFKGAESGDYAKRHNPFLYYPSVADNPRLCTNVVPETKLDAALAHHRLPNFAWISPDLCDDAHSCPLAKTNEYLAGLVPRLLPQLGPHGLLIVTFDEGSSNARCCGNARGGRVATILLGPEVRKGARLHHPYSHYSLLATLEDRFHLPRLRNARSATPLTAAFKSS